MSTTAASAEPKSSGRVSAWGRLRDSWRWLNDPYGFLDERLRREGLTFRVQLPVLGNVLMTGEPELIAAIVHEPALDGGKSVSALRAALGARSLIMLTGARHAARRRLIAPFFHGEALARYDQPTAAAVAEVVETIPTGVDFSIYEVVRRISLRIMVRILFRPAARAEEQRLAGLAEQFLGSFRNPLTLFLSGLRRDLGRFSPWGRAVRNRQALCNALASLVRHCRTSASPASILEQIVTASATAEPALSDDELVEEVLALLLFGHDTGAATMAWAFGHIYQDEGTVRRLRCEAEATSFDGESIDAKQWPLLDACIQESMRLCPVVVHLSRTANQDLHLGPHRVRAGERVIPCTYLAHHNPAVFPAPYTYTPQRFLGGNRYDHAYFPFGFGPRTCVGKAFVQRQMLLVLATMMKTMDLELAPGYQLRPVRQLVLIVPAAGTQMRRRA